MKVLADAHALPLCTASVDLVVGHPPYPGNGYWEGAWPAGIDASMAECRRVMKPTATGWFMLPHHDQDRWLYFDQLDAEWRHTGSWHWLASLDFGERTQRVWGQIPDNQIAPIILANSKPGDTVLDPFAGKGSIPRVAASLGRIAIGVDIDSDQLNGGPHA